MPLYSPDSHPLSFVVCGGSNPGLGEALDSYGSIQLDAGYPQWTIERMPSQRVIPCMAAFPDGIHLIHNGAYQVVAVFRLTTSPTTKAILYDPTNNPTNPIIRA